MNDHRDARVTQNPINWFPGHMAKAMRHVREKIKAVDLVIEVRDARVPMASANNKLNEYLGQKPRLIVLNKSDLADSEILSRWEQWFKRESIPCISVNALESRNLTKIVSLSREITADKWRRFVDKGIVPPPLRMMIVGIPNTGKSTLINRLVSKKAAKTGNRPGVTRSNEWVVLKNKIELLDTPGIMPPKIANDENGLWLCAIHSIKDEIVGKAKVARFVVDFVVRNNPVLFYSRYKIDDPPADFDTLMKKIAETLNCRKKGGRLDMNKAYDIVLRDFREGVFGKFCFESPPDEKPSDDNIKS